MLYNTSISMALKGYNGGYSIETTSIFELESLNDKFTSFNIKLDKNKCIILMIKCPICGHKHCYSYNLNDIIRHDLLFAGCETMGVPLLIIGKNNNVEKIVNNYYETSKKAMAMI